MFPAHAGMDRISPPTAHGLPECSPHTRGWTAEDVKQCMRACPCSPHTRGWTEKAIENAIDKAMFPAHAGMDRQLSRPLRSRKHVPRTRGDGPRVAENWNSRARHVPRTRGDGPYVGPPLLPPIECSPHTRGWIDRSHHRRFAAADVPRTRGDGPFRWRTAEAQEVMFPARAGMDRL